MAENYGTHLKEFSVGFGRSGDKEDRFGGFYSRVRTIRDAKGRKFKNTDDMVLSGQNWTGHDTRRAFFGLWSKKEQYVWSGRNDRDGAVVFLRNQVIRGNSLATTTTDFHGNGAVKEKTRRYITGDYRSKSYDADGNLVGGKRGDFSGYRKWGQSDDGRTSYVEEKRGPLGRRKEALLLPDGTSTGWRTVQRNIGPYRMNIDVAPDGMSETRRWSFGKLISRSTEYNFETGTKTTSYAFPLRKRTNKDRNIEAPQMRKHEIRTEQREYAQQKWVQVGVYATHLLPERAEYNETFEAALASRDQGKSGRDVDTWYDQIPTGAETLQTQSRHKRRPARHDRGNVGPDDSISVVQNLRREWPQPAPRTAPSVRPLSARRGSTVNNEIQSSHEPAPGKARSGTAQTPRRPSRSLEPGANAAAREIPGPRVGGVGTSSISADDHSPVHHNGSRAQQKAPMQKALGRLDNIAAGRTVGHAPSFLHTKPPRRAVSEFSDLEIIAGDLPGTAQAPEERAAPSFVVTNSSVAGTVQQSVAVRQAASTMSNSVPLRTIGHEPSPAHAKAQRQTVSEFSDLEIIEREIPQTTQGPSKRAAPSLMVTNSSVANRYDTRDDRSRKPTRSI